MKYLFFALLIGFISACSTTKIIDGACESDSSLVEDGLCEVYSE